MLGNIQFKSSLPIYSALQADLGVSVKMAQLEKQMRVSGRVVVLPMSDRAIGHRWSQDQRFR